MLLKIKNIYDNWEIWDGVTHLVVRALRLEPIRPKKDEAPGLQIFAGMKIPTAKGEVPPFEWEEISKFPDVTLFNVEDVSMETNPRWGRFLEVDFSNGMHMIFAFFTEGYLMSDTGKTLESFNKR